jgi:hypothetical protein
MNTDQVFIGQKRTETKRCAQCRKTGARLQHLPQKYLTNIAQDTGISKPSAQSQNSQIRNHIKQHILTTA